MTIAKALDEVSARDAIYNPLCRVTLDDLRDGANDYVFTRDERQAAGVSKQWFALSDRARRGSAVVLCDRPAREILDATSGVEDQRDARPVAERRFERWSRRGTGVGREGQVLDGIWL